MYIVVPTTYPKSPSWLACFCLGHISMVDTDIGSLSQNINHQPSESNSPSPNEV